MAQYLETLWTCPLYQIEYVLKLSKLVIMWKWSYANDYFNTVQTWPWHGPKIWKSMDMSLGSTWCTPQKFEALHCCEVKLIKTGAKHGPGMVIKLDIPGMCPVDHYNPGLKISELYLANLANLGHTCPQHCPKMALAECRNEHSKEMSHGPNWFSLEKFKALASLKVELGQTWLQHGPNMALVGS